MSMKTSTNSPALFADDELPEVRKLTLFSAEWGWYDASTDTMVFVTAVHGGGSGVSIYSAKRGDGPWLQFAYPGEPSERDAVRALESFLELEK